MGTLIIITLIIAGLLLFAVEVFLIPGISLAGIASGASILYAIYYAFSSLGTQAGFITLGASVVGIAGVTLWFMRSKTVDRLALNQTLNFKLNPLKGLDLQVGDTGVTNTRLTLIGNAEIKGQRIEVQSADGFIEEKTAIRISRIDNGVVYVQRV